MFSRLTSFGIGCRLLELVPYRGRHGEFVNGIVWQLGSKGEEINGVFGSLSQRSLSHAVEYSIAEVLHSSIADRAVVPHREASTVIGRESRWRVVIPPCLLRSSFWLCVFTRQWPSWVLHVVYLTQLQGCIRYGESTLLFRQGNAPLPTMSKIGGESIRCEW